MRAPCTAIITMVAMVIVMTNTNPTFDGDGDETAWALLSVSVLLQGSAVVNSIFMPFESQASVHHACGDAFTLAHPTVQERMF